MARVDRPATLIRQVLGPLLRGLHRLLTVYEEPWIRRRNELICAMVSPRLRPAQRLLDIGAGDGRLSETIRRTCGTNLTLVDNKVYDGRSEALPFVISDAADLPFSDRQFDVCLLSTVLHHADDPERALREAMRVSKGALIVVEDIFETWLDRTWLQLADSLISRELFGHPHNNRTAREWTEQFEQLGLDVVEQRQLDLRYLGVFVFHIRCFMLERRDGADRHQNVSGTEMNTGLVG